MTYIAHEETHAGLKIEIMQDDMPERPHEHFDCIAPMITISDRMVTKSKGFEAAALPLDHMDDMTAMKNWRAIVDLIDTETHDAVFETIIDQSEHKDRRFPYPEDFRDVLVKLFEDAQLDTISRRDDLEKWAALYRMSNIPASVFTRYGHMKGDMAEILVVHLPEWKEKVGSPDYDLTSDDPEKNGEKDMAGSADLYAAWNYGDVYGYLITDPEDEDGDPLDSCWGFYGEYMSHAWNDMIAEARNAAESIAKDRAIDKAA